MKFLTGFLNLILVCLTVTAVFFPVAVLVHEGTHYLIYTWEGIPITSFHVLDHDSLQSGRFGYVTTTKESRFGDIIQEGVATLFTCLFLALMLFFFLLNPLKPFMIRQFELMGIRRNSPHITKHES
jgi:hypothetical protein